MRGLARRLLLLASALALCPAPLSAQTPSAQTSGAQVPKTLRIIVPLAAGGGGDIVARMIAEQVSRTSGISVVVENRPGAGTVLATEYVARAEPDGATLLFTNAAFLINPHVRKQNYDPFKSFEPVCSVVSYPLFVVVKADSPLRTLADFVKAAQAKPGTVTVAAAGPNTASHIALETLKIATKTDVIFVPFPGTAPAITALLGGHVMSLYADYTSVAEPLKNGDLRALSVASAKRFEKFPDVPTVTESGYPDPEQLSWNGLFAPANTPPALLGQLQKLFSDAGLSEEIKGKLAQQGLSPGVACGTEFKAGLQQQYDLFGRVMSSANMKAP